MTEFLFRDDSYLRETPATGDGGDAGGRDRARPDDLLRGVGRAAGRYRACCGAADGTEVADRRDGASRWRQDGDRARAGGGTAGARGWRRGRSRRSTGSGGYRLMRMHTALHLVSVVFPSPITGGSVGEDKGRLDFNMPEVPEDLPRSKRGSTRWSAGDHAVTTEWITDEEMAANPGLIKTMNVKPPMGQGRVRLVRIGDVDLQPCGGTHVRIPREIGPLKLGKIEKKGAINRRVTRAVFAAEALTRGPVDRRGEEQAAVDPERVLAAGHGDAGLGAEIAVEDLAVVADLRDDVGDEAGGEADRGTEVALEAEEAADGDGLGGRERADVGGGDAELLGVDQGEERPLDDLEPLVVAVADHRAERLLADALGEDAVGGGIGQAAADGVEPARRRRDGVAEAGAVGDREVLAVLVEHLVVAHLVEEEELAEVRELALVVEDADRDVVELVGGDDAEGQRHHEGLAVVEGGGDVVARRSRCRAAWSRDRCGRGDRPRRSGDRRSGCRRRARGTRRGLHRRTPRRRRRGRNRRRSRSRAQRRRPGRSRAAGRWRRR